MKTIFAAIALLLSGAAFTGEHSLRTGWQRQTIEGYVTHDETLGLFKVGNKELYLTQTMVGYSRSTPLCFGGQGDYEAAERMLGMPVSIRAVLVANGDEAWWLVEDLRLVGK